MPFDRNFEIDLWRKKNGRRGQHPEVPLVEWDGSEAPRAEEIVYCKEVLRAGFELLGARFPQFLDEASKQKRHGSQRSPAEKNRVWRGRGVMNQWAEENG